MLKKILVLLLCLPFFTWGQRNEENEGSFGNIHLDFTALGIGTSNGQVPFWMRTNTNGSIPLHGASGAFIGSLRKDYKPNDTTDRSVKPDWAAGLNVRLNAGYNVRAILSEAFIKARYSIFEITAGRRKDIMGLVDSGLSSGAFSQSGNALGIPKVEISIPDYWSIPLTHDLIAIKGNFAFGYVGTLDIHQKQFTYTSEAATYFHQKSLYGRIGRPGWRLNLYGGFNHQVYFGDDAKILGPDFKLSGAKYLWHVVSGEAYGNRSIATSKIGNHIGSIDQAASYDLNMLKVTAYHQFFYDVGALYHLTNLKDGLWGISLENKKQNTKSKLHWNKFLIELLYSKSQGGELREKPTPSGDEDYYNNYVYAKGWTYKDENIGNNFLTNKNYQKAELPGYKLEYFGNNRILLLHLGAQWQLMQWSISNKFSFSRNYGTYATSPIGNTTGKERSVHPPPYFTPVNQFSGYIEASRPLRNNLHIGFVLAADYGDLLYNSVGGIVKLTKTF